MNRLFGPGFGDLIPAPVLVAFVLWMVGIELFGWANGRSASGNIDRCIQRSASRCDAGRRLRFSDSSEIALHIKS
jgi:hypothetical protein